MACLFECVAIKCPNTSATFSFRGLFSIYGDFVLQELPLLALKDCAKEISKTFAEAAVQTEAVHVELLFAMFPAICPY